MTTRPPRLCLFGASDDTGNLGVSALMTGALTGLGARLPDAHLTVFDNGRGRRYGAVRTSSTSVRFDRLGARVGHRYHRGENLRTMSLAAKIGGSGNQGARAVLTADAVLDISGGDSFTDLYGPRRFDLTLRPKQMALRAGAPLILLPQTYGPFHTVRSRQAAVAVLKRSTLAYARGADGYIALQDLLGAHFDPERHRQGVDMALAMAPRRPQEIEGEVSRLLSSGRPLVGVNVSGLLFRRNTASFGLSADYDLAVSSLVRRLLTETETHIVLVPHVTGTGESDVQACRRLAEMIGQPSRIIVAPDGLDAQGTKWLISQTDWFCGTRMHATIAALSTGTPTAAIAYSHKTREVFETCGVPDEVADARNLTTAQLTDQLWSSWTERGRVQAALNATLPRVLDDAMHQLDDIAATIKVGSPPLPDRSVT